MSDMNGLNNALKNLNTYCQEQGSRLRETLSQQRPSNQSSPNSASSTPTSQPNGSYSGAPSAPMSAPFPAPLPAPPQSVPRGVTRQGTGIAVPRALPRLPTGHPPPVRPMGAPSARVPRSAPPAGPPPQAPPPAAPPISKKTSLPSQPSKDGPKAPPTPRRLSADDRIFELDMEERRAKGYGMTRDEFRVHGKEMVEYITDYMENIHKRRVVPAIEPGYLKDLIPGEAPTRPESYTDVMQDFEKYIMPGVTHWQHPRFHAYFPAGNSWPSILADMLSDALGCVGFSWAACPAMTELEMIMLEWFGKMIGLPESFLPFTEGAKGGGVIQSSASECNFTSLLAARFEVMKELRVRFPFVEEGLLLSKLIAYCSKEAHSSVEKACMIGMVKLRILETDSKFRLRGETLRNAIQEDRNLGLIPFFVSTTLGTTSCCSFDMLSEIGPVCEENELWLHVDAAYAGSAMICPEFRYLMDGIQYAMSFNTNPNKWLTVNFDCSTMWVKDRFKLTQALVVDPLYLQHSWMDKSIDYRHWGIPLSRRFRSLKLWFVIRMYGVEGLQNYVREHVRLAKKFEGLLRADPMMEIVGEVIMGLVCFRMKATEEANQLLLTRLNSSGRIHMVPASLNDRFVIRFCVCAENATDSDIQVAYDIISQMARHIMQESVAEPIVEEQELEQLEEQNYAAEEEKEEKTRPPSRRESMDGPPRPLERALSKEELLTKRHTESLAKKRSFLVRMVSDPKCYNPKIVRHLNMANHRKMSQDVYRDRTLMQTISHRPNHLSSTSSHSQSPGTTYPGCGFEHEEDDTVMPSSHTGLQTPI